MHIDVDLERNGGLPLYLIFYILYISIDIPSPLIYHSRQVRNKKSLMIGKKIKLQDEINVDESL